MEYDIVIRSTGYGEWLPIILTPNGTELYRGDRVRSSEEALRRAREVFDNDETGNIVEFKAGRLA